ncbi:hypothetical protein BJY01DRAFT_106794 [Aspergillus pseudoustus]|uniref:Uncharacterized protein n=1 Tax=Aspergillus pseudoustus TaxID=1810923 RepID=A0ABR4IV67_9EURO
MNSRCGNEAVSTFPLTWLVDTLITSVSSRLLLRNVQTGKERKSKKSLRRKYPVKFRIQQNHLLSGEPLGKSSQCDGWPAHPQCHLHRSIETACNPVPYPHGGDLAPIRCP